MQIPEVSLISSWHIPSMKEVDEDPQLSALRLGLRQQIAQHDLYFLNHADMQWYKKQLRNCPREGESPALSPEVRPDSPLHFAAALRPVDVEVLAEALTEYLAAHFKGRLVGPRPRFTALATYWPLISLLEDSPEAAQLRESSVKALASSLLLASRLGCRHVEIVGGSALPEDLRQAVSDEQAQDARQRRQKAFCRSLRDAYETAVQDITAPSLIPAVCLEIEPGDVYLIKDVDSFAQIRGELADNGFPWMDQVLLNVDLAHMMLTEGDDGKTGSELQLERARQDDVRPWIGHMHMSDHARTHAADLCPGTYHFYHHYQPWLKLALQLCQDQESRFSRVIAVELEACGDIFEVVRAVGKTRRWVAHTAMSCGASDSERARRVDGALLVVDIGHSTECLAEASPLAIEGSVREICQAVHRQRGSVFSFTGDGVVAFFDQEHFASGQEAARSAKVALECLPGRLAGRFQQAVSGGNHPYLRASLHWGGIHVPTGGPLRYQAIGREVVIACRLCSQADKKETGKPEDAFCHIAASEHWLSAAGEAAHLEMHELAPKGIQGKVKAAFWKLWHPAQGGSGEGSV